MQTQLHIGHIHLDVPILLAPMAGVTDRAFRLLCRRFGAQLVYSEFISADGIIRENLYTLDKIRFSDAERPIGIQIFGKDPQSMYEATRKLCVQFQPDIIDINYGCPVPKVTTKGAGSAALRDLCLMHDITAAVVEAARPLPVTVKMRAGWDEDSIVVPAAGQLLEKLGVQAITLHPRTTLDLYKNKADWSRIQELKAATTIPIIGNGDVKNFADYQQLQEKTGCDGVMIGRGALGNPWIFAQLFAGIKQLPLPSKPTHAERIDLCLEHLQMSLLDKGNHTGLNIMRKHFAWYLQEIPYARHYRPKLLQVATAQEAEALLLELKTNSAAKQVA